jgi:hypothetical protein
MFSVRPSRTLYFIFIPVIAPIARCNPMVPQYHRRWNTDGDGSRYYLFFLIVRICNLMLEKTPCHGQNLDFAGLQAS